MAELGALVGAVTSHRHVGKRPEVCDKETRETKKGSVMWKQRGDARSQDGGGGEVVESTTRDKHQLLTFTSNFGLHQLLMSSLASLAAICWNIRKLLLFSVSGLMTETFRVYF